MRMFFSIDLTTSGDEIGDGGGGVYIADVVPGVTICGYVVEAGRDIAGCCAPPAGIS